MTHQQLQRYLAGYLAKRPWGWDCARFVLGAWEAPFPYHARDMLARLPSYTTRAGALAAQRRRGIRTAEDYCRQALKFSRGAVQYSSVPVPGGWGFSDAARVPTVGLVGFDGNCYFLGAGGFVRVPCWQVEHYVRPTGVS